MKHVTLDHDVQYQALRLRGLASLIRATGPQLAEVTHLEEVTFFLASVLDDIAENVAPRGDMTRRTTCVHGEKYSECVICTGVR